MTNAEKYKEVFGIEADRNACPTKECSECPYRKDNDDVFPSCFYGCSEWWDSEYKEAKND